ncbi:MAG: hypothetical protein K6C05_10895 [Anaerovibrio sp.]|uniref:hypothetical protein n=1 Tax=Anaerovibrio sp. TaxID=1872532 RepID=UPI0025F51844|nr:hypothetical protein [Anaerovibrio sp.]MCR5177334.1 hypothetical protein [Anaerovibrio sp.]
MAIRTSRLSKLIAVAMLGLSLSGGSVAAAQASDAETELAALETELAALEAELAQERGTIKEEKAKVTKEPNKTAISGDARVKYAYLGNGANWYYRGRIALKHDINDTVSVYARWGLMNDNPMGLSEHYTHKINTFSTKNYQQGYSPANIIYPDMDATDGSWVSDANLQVKRFLGTDKTTLGRFGQTFGSTGLMGNEDSYGGIDGVKFDWSGKVGALTVGYAKFGALSKYPAINTGVALTTGTEYVGSAFQRKPIEQALFINAKVNLGPAVSLHGMWIKEMNNGKSQLIATGSAYTPYFFDNPNEYDLRGVGITAQITPTLKLVGDYIINANDFQTTLGVGATSAAKAKSKYGVYKYPRQKAEYISLRYKEAKWGDKGSFGINLDWRHIDPSVRLGAYATANNDYYVMNNTMYNSLSMADDLLAEDGVRGPVLGIHYMLTKNVKISLLQTFANSMNTYQFSFEKKSGGYWSYLNRVNEKADNMTVLSVTAKF